jgi:hypothetical protein
LTNLLVTAVVSSSGSSTSQLGALNATSATTTEWGGKGEVDVLLGLTTDNERGNVDGLLTDAKNGGKKNRVKKKLREKANRSEILSSSLSTEKIACEAIFGVEVWKGDGRENIPDVTLTDQDTGVVDGLGETQLENLSLETTLKEIADGEGEDIIELGLGLVQNTDALEATDEGGTLEHTTGILLVKSEELTSSGTDLGEEELNAPNLVLALEAILTAELELGVKTLLLEGTTRTGARLTVYNRKENVNTMVQNNGKENARPRGRSGGTHATPSM